MADYALAMSEQERARYRFMARMAQEEESSDWEVAGIRAGAAVADVGCGPGAILRVFAEVVGAGGRCAGVERDTDVAAIAADEIADLDQARVVVGSATQTGLEPGSFDVVMCRHVLAHNGGSEAVIVDHLATLARPSGCVYLVDVNFPGFWIEPAPPEIAELHDAYFEAQRRRGNDLCVGRRLGTLLQEAGLTVETFRARAPVVPLPAGLRPPSWAAREMIVEAGVATEADLARWDAALTSVEESETRPWLFAASFVGVGRKPQS